MVVAVVVVVVLVVVATVGMTVVIVMLVVMVLVVLVALAIVVGMLGIACMSEQLVEDFVDAQVCEGKCPLEGHRMWNARRGRGQRCCGLCGAAFKRGERFVHCGACDWDCCDRCVAEAAERLQGDDAAVSGRRCPAGPCAAADAAGEGS